jgi:hypothetical protein
MAVEFTPSLFACSGDGAGSAIAANEMTSLTLAVITALIGYVSLRLWFDTRGSTTYPTICGLLLFFHPAWSVSARSGDCGNGQFGLSVLATGVAVGCVLTQCRPGQPLKGRVEPPVGAGDPRICTSESLHPGAPVVWQSHSIADRIVIGIALRLLAAIPLGLFAWAQYRWYGWYPFGRQYSSSRPNWVLGPLYFLANASPADDWIGYSLLAVAVPCLLSVVVWPNRWTAMVSSLTAWAWVLPVTVKLLLTT